jgi:hypothetical protein
MQQAETGGKVTTVTGRGTFLAAHRFHTSGFPLQFGFFDAHVLEFARLKDVTALKALYELAVFVAGNNLYAGVLTLVHQASLLGGFERGIEIIKPGLTRGAGENAGNWRYFSPWQSACQVPSRIIWSLR